MNDDFRDMLAALVAADARFLVVGAHALAVHGVPRMTGDLDVWVEPSADNARRVWRALAAFGVPLNDLHLKEADFTVPDKVVEFGLPPYRIDVMTSVSGVSFAEAWPGREEDTMLGVPVAFMGRDALVRTKRAAGRKRDLADLEALGVPLLG